jgi:hypothetical protein
MRQAHPPAPFIVGCGRSGTTLLRMMLDSHPLVAIPPETDFLPELFGADLRTPAAFMDRLRAHWRLADLHIETAVLAERVARLQPFDVADAVRALYALYAEKFGKPRFGDKTPFYSGHLETIAGNLPEARFLHMIRDGRDVAASMIPLWFGPDNGAEMGHHWRSTIEEIRSHPDLPVLEVRYEALVTDTEATMGRVLDFCELPWDDAVLRFHERAQGRVSEVTTDAMSPDGRLLAPVHRRHEIHRLLAERPKAERIGAWMNELSADDLDGFLEVAGDLMAELGYT